VGQLAADLLDLLLQLLAILRVPDVLRGGVDAVLLLDDPIVIPFPQDRLLPGRQRLPGALADQLEDLLHDLILTRH